MQKDNLGNLPDKVFIEIESEEVLLIKSIKLTSVFTAFDSRSRALPK